MRCLQCGSQLALLKKFTDGEFCSADHRTVFYDTQQKLIVERLAESARKLKRHKLVTKPPVPIVVPVPPQPEPVPVVKVEERLPAFGGLVPVAVLDALVIRNHSYGLAQGFTSIPPELLLIPPPAQRPQAKRLSRLAGPMPTFLAGRSWKRTRQIELKSAAASGAQPVFPKLAGFGPLDSQGMVLAGRSHIAGELADSARPIPPPEASGSRTASPSGEYAAPELAARNATPATPLFAAHPLVSNGLRATSNPLRVRPRGPLQDSAVAQFCTIKPNSMDGGQATPAVSFAYPIPEIELLGPSASGRFFRARPRGPVPDAALLNLERRIEPGLEPEREPVSAASLSIPSLTVAASPELTPSSVGRFFRMRASGPVQDRAVDRAGDNDTSTGTTDLESFAASASLPSYPSVAVGNFAPRFLDRGFRMRPRGPVAATNLAAFEPLIPASVQPPAVHSSRLSLPSSILGEYAPAFIDKGFRARPRGPVQSPGLAQFEASLLGDAAALTSPPYFCLMPAAVMGACSPIAVRRFFRMGPKAPAASLHTQESIGEGIHQPLLSALALATLPPSVVGEFSPVRQDRFFRARPRGPVDAQNPASMEQISTGASADLVSAPAKGSVPGYLIGQCEPNSIVRFFRARPRGPVDAQNPAAMEQISTGASADLVSAPAKGTLPGYLIGQCEPNSIVRFFRARPRGPVDAQNPAVTEGISTGASADLMSAPAMGTLPGYLIGQCEPNSIVRFFRARPRGPVDAPAVSAYEDIQPGSPAALLSPALAGTLPLSAILECAPNPLVRFFRARPRGPLEAVAPAMEYIAAGPAAELVSKPALGTRPVAIQGECQPDAVVRLFRPRPRGPVEGKTSGSTSETVTPQFLPSVVSSKDGVALARLPVIKPGDVQPSVADRPLRMRPRSGVSDSTLHSFDRIDSGFAAAMESAPRLAVLPASILGGLAPVQLDKPYKMRPRGPVQANQLAAFHQVSTGEAATPPRAGQMPPISVLDGRLFEPVFLDRFYRMRPRGAMLHSDAAHFEAVTAGDPEVLTPKAALPSMPAVLMRQARTPSRDRGPRMRPPGPRPNSGTRNFDRMEEGEEETRVPQASMIALPEAIPPGLPAIEPQVSPVQFELIIHPPLFTRDVIVDYRPSLVEIRRAFEETHKPTWLGRIAAFWSEATWDVKWVTAAVPVLLGVLIHSSIASLPGSGRLPKINIAALASNPLPPLKSVVDARWSDLRHELVGRAAVDLQEDFTSGLRFWTGDPDWSNSWTYDIHGGVKPGALALYTPSIGMSDYDVEFTGEIEKKSLGWVFRSADTRNYYSVKLMTVKPGPLPTVALVRSVVIDGKEGPPTQILLPFPVSKDQVYRVRMEVSGQFFTVFVQGHVVAFWTDDRLRSGGIGFFSGKGEQSRLLAVRVSHQFDALGRLCASLALRDKTSKQSGVSRNESQK